MDIKTLIIGIILFLVGILVTLFSARFARWWNTVVFSNRLTIVSPEDRENLTADEYWKKQTSRWPQKGIWMVWLVGTKVIGVMMFLAGILLILEAVIDLP